MLCCDRKMIFSALSNHYKLIIPVLVLFGAILYRDSLQSYYNNYYLKAEVDTNRRPNIFTEEQLSRYNEVTLYMAVLGTVFDVSKAPQHYAKGSPYHYFVGKDGSRALVTGDFKDETKNKDHVLDLSCADTLIILNWKESLEKKYEIIGILAGRYFESNGKRTGYLLEFSRRIGECMSQREDDKKQDSKYPPCNIAWSEHEGTKVWCTKTSGGIYRDWVGVPRQFYTPGENKPKCVCLNQDEKQDTSVGLFKEYDDCSNTSVVCFVDSS